MKPSSLKARDIEALTYIQEPDPGSPALGSSGRWSKPFQWGVVGLTTTLLLLAAITWRLLPR
jgi:hypothetical protein